MVVRGYDFFFISAANDDGILKSSGDTFSLLAKFAEMLLRLSKCCVIFVVTTPRSYENE